VLAELEHHPHARAVLEPALRDGAGVSHAYLFHGPGGSGKRAVARAIAAELLSRGSPNPDSARARALSGAHPDLTWVRPSGAHEMLVGDIEEPVIAAASKTPFEALSRVFVIERVDELGDEAANRMLKTLEEPASFVHLILITDRLVEVLPTIRSRCQLVRFDPAPSEEVAAAVRTGGVPEETAIACARLALGDAERAGQLAGKRGQRLRAGAEEFARATLSVEPQTAGKPWSALLSAVKAAGVAVGNELEDRKQAELEMYPRKEQRRVSTEWDERIKRARRRAETGTLDLGLQLVSLWYADLAHLAWGAEDLVRNTDRLEQLRADAGHEAATLHHAVELVEDTRQRFQLNVSEELACEALAYKLQRTLGR
jgi:DNA polymerase III subunit delta'